jgi:hypothetical protein
VWPRRSTASRFRWSRRSSSSPSRTAFDPRGAAFGEDGPSILRVDRNRGAPAITFSVAIMIGDA